MELFDIHEYPSFFMVQRIDKKIHIEKYDGKLNFPDMVKFFSGYLKENQEKEETIAEKIKEEKLPAPLVIDAHNYEHYIFQEYKSVMLHFTDGVRRLDSWDYLQYRFRGMFLFAEINC